MTCLPSGQDGPGLRICDKCGQQRRTTQVDAANGGPWLCAGCFLSYAPSRQAGSEAPSSASSRRGRRLSSLGQSTISQSRDHGESRAGASLARATTASSATTLPTVNATQRPVTSNTHDSLTDFARLGSPLGARAKARPQTGVGLTHSGSEPGFGQTSSSRSRPENHRGPPAGADFFQNAIPKEVFKPKLVSALARNAAKAREALEEREREQQAARDKQSHHTREPREHRDREKREHKEHRRLLEVDVVEATQEKETSAKSSSKEASSKSPSGSKTLRLQCEELIGGFRRGDVVCSLISRERRQTKVLEPGHNGEVISVQVSATYGSDPMLLVQFALGFDWLLSPHQICPQADYSTTCTNKLAGGFHFGDRVRILVDGLVNTYCKRGLVLGDTGTVVGPGHAEGKIAIRFDGDAGEWNIWPGALCHAEAYTVTLLATLAGSFRRGDRVQAKTVTAAKGDASKPSLQAGDEGIVVGPGHISSRILVKFDIGGRTWSMRPSQICAASMIVDLAEKECYPEATPYEEKVS